MKRKFTVAPAFYSKISVLLLVQLLCATILQAQRGMRVPVPVPQGTGNLFPDWVFLAIFGIIALVIVVSIIDWIVSCFRDFRSFSELLALAGIIAATWFFWKVTGWGFGWCLLAGYACGMLIEHIISFLQREVAKRN